MRNIFKKEKSLKGLAPSEMRSITVMRKNKKIATDHCIATCRHSSAFRTGFTLIEILIVVAIIAILASVVLVGLGPTQQSGRDARRLSDLRQIQTGLELYFNKCGYYPGSAASAGCGAFAAASFSGVTTALKGSGIGISSVPHDPTSGASYYYKTGNNGSTYILAAKLENLGNSAFANYTAPDLTPYTDGGDTISSCAAPFYCITL